LGTLSYFPVRAAHIFLGKNLAAFIVGVAELLLLLILQGALSGNWAGSVVLGFAGLAGLIATLGPANAIAVLVPLRIARQGAGREQGDSGSGCVSSLLIFVSYLVVGVLVIPILAAVLLPVILHHTELYPILLPASILYGIGIYVGGTALASAMYYDRLPKIMEVVTRE
jgi:ABC-2 type transport system permease protein